MLFSNLMQFFLVFITTSANINYVKGYPVEQDYNPNIELKKQLCPPGQTSPQYRYHNETKKCYKTGESGPCGGNMIFTKEENSSAFGYCECDFQNADIPLVYDETSNRCYFIYTKAYCDPGQWLVFSKELSPQCVKNTCEDTILMFEDDDGPPSATVEYKGKCVLLNKRNANCKPGEVIKFQDEEENPHLKCGTLDSNKHKILPTSLINPPSFRRCRPGSVKNILGKCRAAIYIPKE